jgi:hypothetical protein
MIEAARGPDADLRAACLIAFRDRTGDDAEYVGAVILGDAIYDLSLIRSAFQKKK